MAILQPDKIKNWNGVKINEYFLTDHNPNKIDMPIQNLPAEIRGITIHNTDWLEHISTSTTQAEQYTRATVNGNMGTVRVHFYVDDTGAWQNLPLTLSGWHAADGGGDGNRKTISIECIMDGSENSYSLKAEENAIRLIAYLLYKYNLNVDNNLFTHNHWLNVKDKKTGTTDELNRMKNPLKNCPAYILPHWAIFKAKVRTQLNKLKEKGNNEIIDKPEETVIKTEFIAPPQEKEEIKVTNFPTLTYRAYSNNSWSNEFSTDANGEAAAIEFNRPINGIAIKVDGIKVRYKSHYIGGKWLNWIEKYNIGDWKAGISGMKLRQTDAIQIELADCPDYEIQYRVAANGKWLNWITGLQGEGVMSYAGSFGRPITKIQMRIIKK